MVLHLSSWRNWFFVHWDWESIHWETTTRWAELLAQ